MVSTWAKPRTHLEAEVEGGACGEVSDEVVEEPVGAVVDREADVPGAVTLVEDVALEDTVQLLRYVPLHPQHMRSYGQAHNPRQLLNGLEHYDNDI